MSITKFSFIIIPNFSIEFIKAGIGWTQGSQQTNTVGSFCTTRCRSRDGWNCFSFYSSVRWLWWLCCYYTIATNRIRLSSSSSFPASILSLSRYLILFYRVRRRIRAIERSSFHFYSFLRVGWGGGWGGFWVWSEDVPSFQFPSFKSLDCYSCDPSSPRTHHHYFGSLQDWWTRWYVSSQFLLKFLIG